MSAAAARRAAEEVRKTYGTGLVALIKQGWNEIPEIMATSAMAVVGSTLGIVLLYIHVKNDGDNKPYKTHYTIFRSDDPRMEKLNMLLEKEKKKGGK